MIMDGGNPAALISPPAMLLVFGGTFGVAMASGLMKDVTGAGGIIAKALKAKPEPPDETIAQMVDFAERARREGLLALEEVTKTVENPFLKKGIELAVDGTDPEELREILENDIGRVSGTSRRPAPSSSRTWAASPRPSGIIGTVIGLVHVLQNLSDPGKLGPLIAGAFIATLWGVMSANVIWLPIANRLKRIAEIEVHHRELLIEGILSIQAGANPRIVQQRLLSHLPDKDRAAHRGRGGVTMAHKTHKPSAHEEEHENHERWLITYADMITLLMVLFIVLFAIGQVDLAKFQALKHSLNTSFGGAPPRSNAVVNGGSGRADGRLAGQRRGPRRFGRHGRPDRFQPGGGGARAGQERRGHVLRQRILLGQRRVRRREAEQAVLTGAETKIEQALTNKGLQDAVTFRTEVPRPGRDGRHRQRAVPARLGRCSSPRGGPCSTPWRRHSRRSRTTSSVEGHTDDKPITRRPVPDQLGAVHGPGDGGRSATSSTPTTSTPPACRPPASPTRDRSCRTRARPIAPSTGGSRSSF